LLGDEALELELVDALDASEPLADDEEEESEPLLDAASLLLDEADDDDAFLASPFARLSVR
jgi:hypothetical protein